MLKKLILLLMTTSFLIRLEAKAEQERIINKISQGQEAPFTGYILNRPALEFYVNVKDEKDILSNHLEKTMLQNAECEKIKTTWQDSALKIGAGFLLGTLTTIYLIKK